MNRVNRTELKIEKPKFAARPVARADGLHHDGLHHDPLHHDPMR
jgi:hypothetical protein